MDTRKRNISLRAKILLAGVVIVYFNNMRLRYNRFSSISG